MTVDIHSDDARLLRLCMPISTISAEAFAVLCKHIEIEQAEAGAFLFRQGDTDPDLLYLLEGSVNLQTETLKVETISAGTEPARFALAHQIPRKIDALVAAKIRFVRIKPELIRVAKTPAQAVESKVSLIDDESEDADADEDWMTTLLKSPVFRDLPPANLQRILIGLESVHLKQGEIVIEQGAEGDFYYVIKKGQCLVARKPTPTAKEVRLGQLSDLDAFGEDSLITGDPRNVTVVALTDVSLLRLSKALFLTLIKQPSVKYVSYQDALDLMASGAVMVDIRDPDAFDQGHIAHAINLPFFSLRMHVKNFNKQLPVIVVCHDGRKSEAAVFFLLRNKLTAFVLQGGVAERATEQLVGNTSLQPVESQAATAGDSEAVLAANVAQSNETDEAVDIDALKETVQRLQVRCITLETEKQDLEKRYKLLYAQTEKMKNLLDAIRSKSGK